MSMIELAHNSCYADDKRNARYRDYDLDIDSRQLVRNLMKDMCGEDLSDLSDEEFDEYMGSVLSIELDSEVGLFALFYRNLWAMANLRETLKKYEDLEEQGRLVKLPCKVGDMLYYPEKLFDIVVPVRLNEIIISSLGTQNSKERKKIFLEGYEEMIKRLDPAQIIFYGRVPEECKGNIVHIESFSEKFHKAEVAQW